MAGRVLSAKWQRHDEFRATLRLVADFHRSAMLHDDLLHDGKAQAGAVRFGGVEGNKDLREVIGGNAGSIIQDGDTLKVAPRRMFYRAPNLHTAAERLPIGRFGSVAGQIQQGLTQQALVACDTFEFARCRNRHLRDSLMYLRDYAFDDRGQGNIFGGEVERAGEFQELGNNVGQRPSLVHDVLSVLSGIALRLAAYHLGVTRNGRQSIFELMRDTGGEFAKRSEVFFDLYLALQSH